MSGRKIAFASDDVNECVEAVRGVIEAEYELVGMSGAGEWPVMARAVGEAVAGGECAFGVLMCWTGTGTAIAANKVPGVRAATVADAWTARGARLWNDANVLAMSLKRLAPDVAVECLRAFLGQEEPDPDEAENIALIRDL